MEKDNQPSHVKTIKEIMDEECEKGEEVTWRPFKDNLRLRSVKTRTATTAKDGTGHARPDSPLSWNMPARMVQKRSPPAKEKPVKISLMALLADEDDGDDCNKGERNGGGESETMMPCGHTICHLHQRELRASHENCPHCSSFIMEILDVL